MSTPNEWNLLKHQFDALVHNESVDDDSIESLGLPSSSPFRGIDKPGCGTVETGLVPPHGKGPFRGDLKKGHFVEI